MGETTMRVWRANEFDWIAGVTLLAAARAACRERGYHWSELFDRDVFKEEPKSKWAAIGVYDGDEPDNLNSTLATIVAKMQKPGIAMSTEW